MLLNMCCQYYDLIKSLGLCVTKGNIDQVQYCDKIKNIVEFLGTRLSEDELTKIWKMQVCDASVALPDIY